MPPQINPCDLLFYHGGHDVTDEVTSLGERLEGQQDSNIVHVAVITTPGATPDTSTVVEALGPGIRRGMAGPGGLWVPTGANYDVIRRRDAVDWLRTYAGHQYGWADITDNALRLLHVPAGIFIDGTADCSHLAFAALTLAGQAWTGAAADWVLQPELVTPALLFAYCRQIVPA